MVRSNWLRGGFWGAVLLVVTAVVTLVQTRLAVVYLDKEQSGIWFLMLGLSSLLVLLDFGVGQTLVRELGFAANQPQKRQDLLRTAEIISLRIGVVVGCVATPLGIWFLSRLASSSALVVVLPAWFVFSLGAVLSLQSNILTSGLIGLGFMSWDRQARSVWLVVSVLSAYIFLQWQPNLQSLCWGWALGQVGLWLSLRVLLHRVHVFGAYSRPFARHFFALGLRWWWIAVGGYLILNTDNFVIAAVLGTQQVADYALLARLSSLILPFSLIFVVSVVPIVAQCAADGQWEKIRNLLLLHIRIGFLILIPIVVFISSVPEILINIWVGEGHFLGRPILYIFLVMLTLEVHHVIFATVLMATGELPFAPWAIGAGLLNLLLSVVLANWLGLLGVALGTMLAQMLTNNWFAPTITLRALGVHFRDYWKFFLLPALIGFTICVGTGQVLQQLLQGTENFWRLTVSVLAVVASLGFLFFLFFSRHERNKLFSAIIQMNA
ncbi:MAG: MATE family efflux transporter [Deinococcales bacterium]